MKTTITTLLLLMICSLSYSQDLTYEVKGKYTRGISKEKLNAAKTMSDIRPGYPSSWVIDYVSTEVSVISNGKIMKATGADETLNARQKDLLHMAEVGSDIVVEIGYLYPNPVTQIPDIHKMHFEETVVPEVEAEYPGGYSGLRKYLKDNAIDMISEKYLKELQPTTILFTISEKGEITNAQVFKSSGIPEIDKVMLKAINQMPRWKPAENLNGLKIKQDYEFNINIPGC